MVRIKKTTSKLDINNNGNLFMYLIGMFMLIIPFYRGLFFRPNYILAIIFLSLIFAIFAFTKIRDKAYRVLDTYIDIAIFLIPIAYLISFFFAANAKDAFDMFLIYCSYFFLYKISSDLSVGSENFKNALINIIISSTFLLAFTSMLHLAGIISIKGAFIGNRLYGLYQYANTTASVLGVGIILSLNKLINEENIKVRAVYQMVLTTLIPTFIFTLSRGGYLVLAAVLFINFILVTARAKVKLLIGMVVSFLSSSVLIYSYYTIAEDKLKGIWFHYLIGIILSAILVYIVYAIGSRVKRTFTDKSINITLILMTVIFMGAATFLLTAKGPRVYRIDHQLDEERSWKYELINLVDLEQSSKYIIEFDTKASIESEWSYGILIRSYNAQNDYTDIINHFEPVGNELTHKTFHFDTLENTKRIEIFLYNYETNSFTEYRNVVIKDSSDKLIKKMEQLKYIPRDIAARLLDINLTTENASLRIHFAKDGLKIIKDYPLAGAGGGAWRNLYRQYQSLPYNTSEVHNFYVQYGTEVGMIGIAALAGFLTLLMISMINSIRNNSQYLCVYLAVLLLFLHSSIDFNLSIPAVAYLLWTLIGIINSDKHISSVNRFSHKHLNTSAIALSLIVLISASSVYTGIKLGVQGANSINDSAKVDKTIALYERAILLDRFNGAYRIDLIQIMGNELRMTQESRYYDSMIEHISLLRKYEPYNHLYTRRICNALLSLGKFEDASKLADAIVADEPLLEQSYKIKINVNYEIANYHLKNSKMKEAVPYLERVLEAKEKLDEINISLEAHIKLEDVYLKKFENVDRALEMIKSNM